MPEIELAQIRYGSEPRGDTRPLRSTMVCPCGVSNPAMLWGCSADGGPDMAFPLMVCCQGCSRIITRDGVVIGRRVYDYDARQGA